MATWSRREFLKAGSTVAVASSLPATALSSPAAGPRHAFAASNWREGETPGIRVYAADGSGWSEVAFHASDNPSALAMNAAGDRLYVANYVDTFQHLPCGSVETWRVEANGKLHLLHRAPLALASVNPEALAVAPDDSMLLVVASGCSLMNAISINADGCASTVTAVRKELVLPASAALRPQLRFADKSNFVVSDAARNVESLYSCSEESVALRSRQAAGKGVLMPHELHLRGLLADTKQKHPVPLAVVFA